MLNKLALALATVVLATASIQTPVYAENAAPILRDHRAPQKADVRDHRKLQKTNTRDHRSQTKADVRDHRVKPKNEVVKIARKDCAAGYEILRRSGYRKIATLDCQGTEYRYVARKKHAMYGAKMNAYTGKMKVSYMGPVHPN